MLLDAIGLSVVVAVLRGGRRLDGTVRYPWLPVAAFALQFVLRWTNQDLRLILMPISYLLLVAFCALNVNRIGLRVFAVGVVLNALVMGMNGWRMPVDLNAAIRVGVADQAFLSGADPKHVIMTSASPLAFLGDVIALTFPIHRVVSIGDVFTALGAFLFIQELFSKPLLQFGQAQAPPIPTRLLGRR